MRATRVLKILGQAVALPAAALLSVAGCVTEPRYRGPRSDHFDGRRFFDEKPNGPGTRAFFRWQLSRRPGPWPDRVDARPGPRPPTHVPPGQMRVTFINHVTVLVQLAGRNMLTEPIYAERASPFSWVGPRRVRPPGVAFDDLPRIDLVLVSHNHYDHLDLPTLVRLARRDRPLFVVGLGNGPLLTAAGIADVHEVDWWQAFAARGWHVTSVPNQHFSARGLTDRDATLWTAYVVRWPQAGAFYFAGDTGYGAHFRHVGARFPGLRLAVLPIGAYRPEWFMGPVHVTPAEAVQAHQDLVAAVSIAMHFGTFRLADDGYEEPVQALQAALCRAPEAVRRGFWVLGFGEGREVPPLAAK